MLKIVLDAAEDEEAALTASVSDAARGGGGESGAAAAAVAAAEGEGDEDAGGGGDAERHRSARAYLRYYAEYFAEELQVCSRGSVSCTSDKMLLYQYSK